MPTLGVHLFIYVLVKGSRHMRHKPASWLIGLLLLLSISACSSRKFIHVWNERYIVASRLHDEGKYDQAQAHYDQLLKHAPNEEARRLTQYRIALMHLDQARPDQAKQAFEALVAAPTIDEHGARAMYHLVRMEPTPEQRNERCRALILRYPAQVPAEHCLHDLRRYWRDQGDATKFLAELDTAQAKLPKDNELYDYLLFLRAQTLDQDLERGTDAIKAYDVLYQYAPQGPLADDALWESAQIYERQQQWQETIERLSRLVKDIETSWFVGTYESQFADDARYKMGIIYKTQLKQYDQAIDQLERFIQEFPTSLLRDDAAWQIVLCHQLAAHQDWRELAERFIKDYPESRYIPKARALIGQTAP